MPGWVRFANEANCWCWCTKARGGGGSTSLVVSGPGLGGFRRYTTRPRQVRTTTLYAPVVCVQCKVAVNIDTVTAICLVAIGSLIPTG